MNRSTPLLIAFTLLTAAVPASAAENGPTAAATATAKDDASGARAPLPAVAIPVVAPRRPALLLGMYASSAALQGFDGYSTLTALRSGAATEKNAMMSKLVAHPTLFLATKGAVAGATILAADRLWRGHHRGAAIAVMAIVNGSMALVAANNAAALHAIRR